MPSSSQLGQLVKLEAAETAEQEKQAHKAIADMQAPTLDQIARCEDCHSGHDDEHNPVTAIEMHTLHSEVHHFSQ